MKIYTTFLAIIILSAVGFGQTKKPVRRAAPKPDKPKIFTVKGVTEPNATPAAAKKVYITKLNGDLVAGMFLGGNAEFITVKTNDETVSVKLDEIGWINFGSIRTGMKTTDATNAATDSAELTYRGAGNTVQTDTPKRISGGVLNGKAETLVRPEYPAAARAVRASGAVNVQVTIDEQGNIIEASAVSGHPLLRQAAENAARASKFVPTTLQGQPVSVTGIIVYNFVP